MKNPQYHLYRHFDSKGVLLYVGISLSAIERLRRHRQSKSHWANSISNVTIESFPSRESVMRAESNAVRSERPLHNICLQYKRPKKNSGAAYEKAKSKWLERRSSIRVMAATFGRKAAAKRFKISEARVSQIVNGK